MPSIAEVLLPLGAGVASAMNPRVGRAVQGAIGTHLALRDQSAAREQAAQEAAAEERRRQAIADMLSRGDPGNPYMAAAAELARAGAVDPALRMYSQGVGHQVQIADSSPTPGRTGSWRTDSRGQQHYVLVDDATGRVVSSEAWGGEPERSERAPKLSRDTWTDPGTGQEYVDFYDEAGDLVKREARGGRKVAEGEKAKPPSLGKVSVDEKAGTATVETASGDVLTGVPTSRVGTVRRAAAAGLPIGQVPVLDPTTGQYVMGTDQVTGEPAPVKAPGIVVKPIERLRERNAAVRVDATAKPMRREARNRKTGKIETLELRGKTWVPVT